MGSLCHNIIMSSNYIFLIFIIIIIIFMNVSYVNSKVHVLSSQDKLAVKVGQDIIAKMGKDGIKLERFEDDPDKTLKDMLKDASDDDPVAMKTEYEAPRCARILEFLDKSLHGQTFYVTLFWIVFGILIGQLARDILAFLQSSSSNNSLTALSIQDLPPPYEILEDKIDNVHVQTIHNKL